jgi:3-amino-5-hydroxybenzoate synthase
VSDRPAILNGTAVRAGKYWPEWPQWDESERAGLSEVLASGAWSNAHGEQARLWAAEFAALQGARHGLPLTNGTHTLEAALIACGVGEGDEVIVPALTFVATATAALAVNATPVLVDVEADSL